MRIHCLLHAEFEKLGVIENWIHQQGHSMSETHSYRNEKLPTTNEFDMLIIMGGPQSVLELDKYAYLRDEVELAKRAISENKIVLGICLGAQIISVALGAKAEQSPEREIGVYPIQMTRDAEADPLFKHFPPQFDVMHWHSDMPGMPSGGVLLAKSSGCPRQAFRFGDRVYGFQFHMELTPSLVKQMVEHCRDELIPSPYVQKSEELLKLNLTAINQKMIATLDYLATCITQKASLTKDNV